VQFELLAPSLAADVDADMRRRFVGSGIEDALTALITAQIEGLQQAAGDGIVLVAACPRREAGLDDPPSGLSLTLALGNRPPGTPETAKPAAPSPAPAAFASSALPLRLSDSNMTGFVHETHAVVDLPGIAAPLQQFQVQAFVFPAGEPGVITITVTTFDPTLQNDARAAARSFADSLTFVVADEAG
jgi:hypothetical protein